MKLSADPLERRLQAAGVLIILGLLIEAFSLPGIRPVAFLVFVGVGGVLLGAGVLLYLYSLVHMGAAEPSGEGRGQRGRGA
jgi:hypothetical protein